MVGCSLHPGSASHYCWWCYYQMYRQSAPPKEEKEMETRQMPPGTKDRHRGCAVLLLTLHTDGQNSAPNKEVDGTLAWSPGTWGTLYHNCPVSVGTRAIRHWGLSSITSPTSEPYSPSEWVQGEQGQGVGRAPLHGWGSHLENQENQTGRGRQKWDQTGTRVPLRPFPTPKSMEITWKKIYTMSIQYIQATEAQSTPPLISLVFSTSEGKIRSDQTKGRLVSFPTLDERAQDKGKSLKCLAHMTFK